MLLLVMQAELEQRPISRQVAASAASISRSIAALTWSR